VSTPRRGRVAYASVCKTDYTGSIPVGVLSPVNVTGARGN
jgi:hypothetical protein